MSTYNISVERTKDSRVEAVVTFTKEQLAPAEEAALQKLGQSIKVEGFRPGKVPPDMLREKIEPGRVLEEAVRQLLPPVFAKITEEHEIKPIVPPHVEALERDPLKIKIVFVEKPKVTIKNPDKIKVEPKEPKVDEKEVDRMVDYILKQHEKREPVDRVAKQGDGIVMDFRGSDQEGNEIEAIRSEDYKVVLGSKTLLPGFEDELVGLKKGDTKEFTLTFPDKYHAEEFRNKPVTFAVTVKGVEEVTKPELTDEFAKTQLNAESVDTFKEDIRQSMRKQEEQIESQRREQAVLDEIRKATTVDLPDELIQEEMKQLIEDLQKQLAQQELTLQDWLKSQDKKPEELEKELRERASHRLTLRLALQHLVEERAIEAPKEELETEIKRNLEQMEQQQRAQLEPHYQPGGRLYEQMRWQKQIDQLMQQLMAG